MFIQQKSNYIYFIIIAAGLILRLVWNGDMEWKDDEQWMYAKAHEVAHTGHFPEAGMRSGGGIVNPGMSVGVFAFIATFTNDPLAMNRVVQVINILSILCFLLFIFLKVDPPERQVWLMGITLAAVSPLAVLFSRKIWAQDMLPILSFVVIAAHASRRHGWCAFLWGLSGALIGQIHMSGFFFAAGLFVFTVIHDHVNRIKFRWTFWIAGSLVGCITILPWINFMLHNPQITRQSFWHIFQFNFYLYWLLDSFGINIMYSVRKEFWQLIKEPIICGVPTYLIAVIHLYLVGTGCIALFEIRKYAQKGILFLHRKTSFHEVFRNISITRFYLLSILLGLGIFMTLSGTTIYTHYLICAFPFSYIFLAKLFQRRTKLFLGIILAQLTITVTFLFYVHNHNGIIQGDYGKAYHAQLKEF